MQVLSPKQYGLTGTPATWVVELQYAGCFIASHSGFVEKGHQVASNLSKQHPRSYGENPVISRHHNTAEHNNLCPEPSVSCHSKSVERKTKPPIRSTALHPTEC